ncbi:hypothetical protein ACLOJK_010152 [Asimina triloba]
MSSPPARGTIIICANSSNELWLGEVLHWHDARSSALFEACLYHSTTLVSFSSAKEDERVLGWVGGSPSFLFIAVMASFRWILQLHKDVPGAARFYSEGLDFTVNVCTLRWAELQSGPLKLALMQSSSDTVIQKGYSSLLSFTVTDINSTVTKLMALGAELDGSIKYEVHGKVAAMHCLDGHVLGRKLSSDAGGWIRELNCLESYCVWAGSTLPCTQRQGENLHSSNDPNNPNQQMSYRLQSGSWPVGWEVWPSSLTCTFRSLLGEYNHPVGVIKAIHGRFCLM